MLRWTVHLKGGRKTNHVAVAVEHKVYSFGGCSSMSYMAKYQIEVHIFHTLSLDWMKLTPVSSGRGEHPPEVPSWCVGHTAVLVEYVIYIWGGYPYCNRLYAFDVDTHRWLKPNVSGTVPEGRRDHSACVLGKAVYIYGGTTQQWTITNDIYKLDTTTMVWSSINPKGIPPPISRCHSANIIGTKIFVFWGRGGSNYDNNIRVFDTETNCWLSTSSAQLHSKVPWNHSTFTYNGELYIFWGYNITQTLNDLNDDLWKFNPETFSWKKVEPKGKGLGLQRRAGMCCCMMGGRIILYGGYKHMYSTPSDDLFVLDLSPSLKTLCKLAVIQYGLEQSELPHDVRWELVAMTTNNNRQKSSRQRNKRKRKIMQRINNHEGL